MMLCDRALKGLNFQGGCPPPIWEQLSIQGPKTQARGLEDM